MTSRELDAGEAMIPDGAYLDPNRKSGWKVVLDGEILSPLWNSRGAALAGLDVERKRRTSQEPRP